MSKDFDEKEGLFKIYWSDIRKKVMEVEPTFAKIVDQLSPNETFPLYLAFYPYGDIDADTKSTFFPDGKGGYYRLSDSNVPKDVLIHLGYSINNTPFAMVLDKQTESYIDLRNKGITIPCFIYTPGKMFPLSTLLNKKDARIYAPNGLLSSTAGARSVFMLPNIGCSTHHVNLQREFKLENPAPKSLYDHWFIFKEIIKYGLPDWYCSVLYFSQKWIESIHEDKSWNNLKQYLYSKAWEKFQYEMNRINYDMIFSIIQYNRNLKPNPYLTDTAKHLFATALGDAPGFAPAMDDNAFPLTFLQKAYVECYGLKKYIPTIFHPVNFEFEKSNFPIYYSLQHPTTFVFSPKSRKISSTVSEMRELEHIIKIFKTELSKDNGLCSEDSVMYKISKIIKFDYFHNKIDRHQIIQPSINIKKLDNRFKQYSTGIKNNDADFSSDSPFVRGCISIST